MVNSELVATSAVASCPASYGAVPILAVPPLDVERVWDVRVRIVQAPIPRVKGTRMPVIGSQGQAVGVGANRSMHEVNTIYLTATPVPSTVKQPATTGATTGVVPGRAWSPPD